MSGVDDDVEGTKGRDVMSIYLYDPTGIIYLQVLFSNFWKPRYMI